MTMTPDELNEIIFDPEKMVVIAKTIRILTYKLSDEMTAKLLAATENIKEIYSAPN